MTKMVAAAASGILMLPKTRSARLAASGLVQ